jgi:hypothetical protein
MDRKEITIDEASKILTGLKSDNNELSKTFIFDHLLPKYTYYTGNPEGEIGGGFLDTVYTNKSINYINAVGVIKNNMAKQTSISMVTDVVGIGFNGHNEETKNNTSSSNIDNLLAKINGLKDNIQQTKIFLIQNYTEKPVPENTIPPSNMNTINATANNLLVIEIGLNITPLSKLPTRSVHRIYLAQNNAIFGPQNCDKPLPCPVQQCPECKVSDCSCFSYKLFLLILGMLLFLLIIYLLVIKFYKN